MPAVNLIGDFEFISLHKVPFGPAQQLELVEKSGVPGTGIRRLGIRGQVFRLTSNVDLVDFVTATELLHYYRALIGANPVPLVWNGSRSIDYGYLVQVVEVMPLACTNNATAVGGLTGGGTGQLQAEWDLLPIPIPTS